MACAIDPNGFPLFALCVYHTSYESPIARYSRRSLGIRARQRGSARPARIARRVVAGPMTHEWHSVAVGVVEVEQEAVGHWRAGDCGAASCGAADAAATPAGDEVVRAEAARRWKPPPATATHSSSRASGGHATFDSDGATSIRTGVDIICVGAQRFEK